MNISIIGGDLRIIRLAEMYAKDNYNVYTYGLEKYFDKEKGYSKQTEAKVYNKNINDEVHRSNEKFNNIFLCNSVEEAITSSNCIVSGMPFTKDKITVNAPFANEEIKLEELKNKLFNETSSKIFFAGGIPKDYYIKKETKKIKKYRFSRFTRNRRINYSKCNSNG